MNSQSLTRTFWRYSIPAIAALMISGLYMVVDGIFIGHAMGSTGLSAINMAWPLSGVKRSATPIKCDGLRFT